MLNLASAEKKILSLIGSTLIALELQNGYSHAIPEMLSCRMVLLSPAGGKKVWGDHHFKPLYGCNDIIVLLQQHIIMYITNI